MPSRPPADPGIVDTSASLAALYRAPFADFIATRTALVAQLKKSGHKDVAVRLASAAKPSRAAYLVNQVYWRNRGTYDAVLDAGTAARAAQQARLLGDGSQDVAETLRLRDAAVAEATAAAEQVAAEEGIPASEATLGQVRASFEALAAHGREARLAHGHLTADVELPGLAAFAGLILPAAAPPPSRQFQVVARRADPEPAAEPPAPDPRLLEAQATLAALHERERAASERADELARTVPLAQAQVEAFEAAVAEATRRLEQARRERDSGEAALEAARRDLAQVAAARTEAEAAVAALAEPPDDNGGGATGRRGAPAPTRKRSRR